MRTDPVPLTGRQANRLLTALRHGQDLDDAATELGIERRAVWAGAGTDTRLPIAQAGEAGWSLARHRALHPRGLVGIRTFCCPDPGLRPC
ncbi:hypothetical protein AMK32_35530 [Streptomyces sp. CB01883]|nr:hypothetical protein AMK32_35530 [Streptomyces sp. CB01883]